MEPVIQKTQGIWQTKAEVKDRGEVEIAVNAFGNQDSDGDISMQGSFTRTLNNNFKRIRWFLNHNVTQLLGVPLKGYETDEYLVMRARFNMEKQMARDTYEDYKLYQQQDNSLEHSIGVQAIKYDIDEETGIRTVREWKLWEFSTLTFWGANEDTPLLSIKQRKKVETMLDNTRYSDQKLYHLEQFLQKQDTDSPSQVLWSDAQLNQFLTNLNFIQ